MGRWLKKHLSGSISFKIAHWCVVIFGFNAMHVAIHIWTKRWGYICFHPTVRCFGKWWRWYFYLSPNATPWAATFAIGPGIREEDKVRANLRQHVYGHNFPTSQYSYDEIQLRGMAWGG